MGKDFQRLPTTIVPLHYKLDLTPNLDDFTFKGEEVVELDVKEETKQIKLNCDEIDVKSASVDNQSAEIQYDKENEALILNFTNPIKVQKQNLNLSFTGTLNDKLKGFYRSKYINENKQEKFCAVTQFESTDARRCFPCWDEPAVKSKFTCSLTIPNELVGISNMPVTETIISDDGKTKKLQFDTSPIMSTYLLAFYVGEADFVEGKTKYGVTVRVYTPKGKSSQGDFALSTGIKCLEFYEDYFGIKYPLPKLDQIGLDDFAAGAMENWGLVTYRSNILLIDPKTSTTQTKEHVAIVVAHELAHQWFGNLVTMEWWTSLWLNEGFATFMEYLSTDSIYPEFNIFDTMVKDSFTNAMNLDKLDSSHPIEVEVKHPDDVSEIFDHISYYKGCCTIRMCYTWIGNENFKKGMKVYLEQNAYKNAVTGALWEALENQSKMPVNKVMDCWVKQTGFPIVTVEKVGTNKLKLTQKKFSGNGPKHVENDETKWFIPILIANAESPNTAIKNILMEDSTMEIEVDESSWYKINSGVAGFYNVKYKNMPEIEISKLHIRDRLMLQADTFSQCTAGYSKLTEYFNLMNNYKNESEHVVISNILGNFTNINYLIRNLGPETRQKFNSWRLEKFLNLKNKLGWENSESDSHLDTLLRSMLIENCGVLGDKDTFNQAMILFNKHVDEKDDYQLPADLRSPVFKIAVSNDQSGDNIKTLIDLWTKNSDSQEQQSIIERAISSTKNPENIQTVITWAKENVKSCNLPWIFIFLSSSSAAGLDETWSWIQNNIEWIKENIKGFLLNAMIGRTVKMYAKMDKYNEIKEFFEKNKIPGCEMSLAQALETIASNARCLDENVKCIEEYFC